jgi:dienelactone hydrolase
MGADTAVTVVGVPCDAGVLQGDLAIPPHARGLVLFAHGSGSSRHSPRNRSVAAHLNDHGLATLLIDLLTEDEERAERETRHLRFDIELLIDRLTAAVRWLRESGATAALPVGCFGASTGAAAALGVAAHRPDEIRAVVCRGGRPDLTPRGLLGRVRCPTLLIVGGDDAPVLELNRDARRRMRAEVELEVIPGAGHLFEEPGALERVAALACAWFLRHLDGARP